MEDLKKMEVLTAINNNSIYDYIANNYYKLEKEDLKNILLEYIYQFYMIGGKKENREDIFQELKERL